MLPGTATLHVITHHDHRHTISSFHHRSLILDTHPTYLLPAHLVGFMPCTSCTFSHYHTSSHHSPTLQLALGSVFSPSVCTTCGVSTYSPMGSSACTYSLQSNGCPAGTFPVAPNQCQACAAGSYSLVNSPSCTLCPVGKYCPSTGLAVGYGPAQSTDCPRYPPSQPSPVETTADQHTQLTHPFSTNQYPTLSIH